MTAGTPHSSLPEGTALLAAAFPGAGRPLSWHEPGGMRRLLSLLLLLLLAAPASADLFGSPKADGRGDYRAGTRHEYWQVVDPDPRGLYGRRHPGLPALLKGAPAWPDRSIPTWPVVRNLKAGTVLVLESKVANPVLDDRGKPWLAVWQWNHRDEGFFLVRAGTGFVRPIRHPLPQADARGDYSSRTLQSQWEVVDPDPSGLRGRLSPRFPANYEDPRQEWPPLTVSTWPEVARFAPGTVLSAVLGNVGAIHVKDPEGRCWLMVHNPAGGICFVRANHRFLRPLASEIEMRD